jgi:hypothetical protein
MKPNVIIKSNNSSDSQNIKEELNILHSILEENRKVYEMIHSIYEKIKHLKK